MAALFLNTHPAELAKPGLVESLEELRALAPNLDLTLEIHESALAQPDSMGALRDRLSEINVGLAYDDFGAGQARLLELAEAPPHYLKFDREVRLEHRPGPVVAPAPAVLAGGGRPRAAREDDRGRHRDRGRGRGVRQAGLHPRPGLPLRPPRAHRGVLAAQPSVMARMALSRSTPAISRRYSRVERRSSIGRASSGTVWIACLSAS